MLIKSVKLINCIGMIFDLLEPTIIFARPLSDNAEELHRLIRFENERNETDAKFPNALGM